MDLVRDLLDKRVVDRHGRELGRVDRILLDCRKGRPPQVVAIQVGPSALAARLSVRFGRWVEGVEHGLGVDEGRPMQIPVQEILSIGDAVKIDVAFGETAAATIELGLRRWVRRIPEVE